MPLYFTPTAEPGSRNDFLGAVIDNETLPSFGINPGGYVGFFDPKAGEHVTFSMKGDERARKRLAVKQALVRSAEFGSRRGLRIGGWPREKSVENTLAGGTPARARAAPTKPKLTIQSRSIDQAQRAVESRCKRSLDEVHP